MLHIHLYVPLHSINIQVTNAGGKHIISNSTWFNVEIIHYSNTHSSVYVTVDKKASQNQPSFVHKSLIS